MFVLDVGCGNTPIGDVNCDLSVEDPEQHRSPLLAPELLKIDTKKTANFVLCDAHYLPFKNGCFDLVTSRQVIEHIPKPGLMAAEMVRVSRDLVVVETVHRRGERLVPRDQRKWFAEHHINKFDFSYFAKLAKILGCSTLKNDSLDYKYVVDLVFIKFMRVPSTIRVIWSKRSCNWMTYSMTATEKNSYLTSLGLSPTHFSVGFME